MFSRSWEQPNVRRGLQPPPVLFTPRQGNHGVSAGRGVPALLRMLSGCAAAQSSSWASPAHSAMPEGISRGMAWHGLSFRLLERGCGTLDVLAVPAKHVLSSTGSVAEGQATPAPPEQLCEHTHCPWTLLHTEPHEKRNFIKFLVLLHSCNLLVYPPQCH